MSTLLRIISSLGLALTILPPVLFLAGSMTLERVQVLMILGTVVWFLSAPIGQRLRASEDS